MLRPTTGVHAVALPAYGAFGHACTHAGGRSARASHDALSMADWGAVAETWHAAAWCVHGPRRRAFVRRVPSSARFALSAVSRSKSGPSRRRRRRCLSPSQRRRATGTAGGMQRACRSTPTHCATARPGAAATTAPARGACGSAPPISVRPCWRDPARPAPGTRSSDVKTATAGASRRRRRTRSRPRHGHRLQPPCRPSQGPARPPCRRSRQRRRRRRETPMRRGAARRHTRHRRCLARPVKIASYDGVADSLRACLHANNFFSRVRLWKVDPAPLYLYF